MKIWFYNLNVRRKLLYVFSLLIFLVTCMGVISYWSIYKINYNVDLLSATRLPSIDLLLQIDRDMQQALVAQRTMIFTQVNNPRFKELKNDYEENLSQVEERWVKFRDIVNSIIDNNILDDYEKKKDEWLVYSNKIVERRESDTPDGRFEAIELSFREGTTTFNDARDVIDNLTGIIEKMAEEDEAYSEVSFSSATTSLFVGLILVILVAVLSGTGISRMIALPLLNASQMMKEFSKGLIGKRMKVDRRDELGELSLAMNEFAENLTNIVETMNKISDGDLTAETKVLDENDEISPALNKIAYTLRDLKKETDMLITSALEGRLKDRGNASKFNGGYREIINGFNNTLDAVIKPVEEGSEVLEIMADGDFSQRVTGNYKGDHQIIAKSINKLGASLNELIGQVKEAVNATASSSSEISSSAEQMAAGAQEQSSQAAEVAGSVEQMAKTIMETTASASKAADSAKEANGQANDGVKKVSNSKEGMNEIFESSNVTANIITSLANKTDQIGEIARVIDEIADQTNLLALNAAIEAARAGEQGRGFAVVADEVRKLAERTTKATKEIAETIKSIQIEAKEADGSMTKANESVQKGMLLTEEIAVVLNDILESTNNAASEIGQVAAASEEQSTAAESISRNVEGINNVSHESAAGTQQIARAAEDLNRLTNNLQVLTDRFKIDVKHHHLIKENYS